MTDGTNETFLRVFLIDFFDLEEIKTLCQDLNVDFDTLGGDGKEGKARELVGYMKRHSRLDDLVTALEWKRPQQWQERRSTEPPLKAPTPRGGPRNFIAWGRNDKGGCTVESGKVLVVVLIALIGMLVAPLIAERVLTVLPTPIATSPITPTPTATYTPPPPTPTPWPVRPDNARTYIDPDARASITSEAVPDPDRPNAIKITFNNPVTRSYGVWVLDLGGFDASQKSALSFWVRGEKGGEQFEVGIKDSATLSGDEPKVSRTVATSTWQRVSIPLSEFQKIKEQNLSALEYLSLGFTYALGSGAIYVDGFVFEP